MRLLHESGKAEQKAAATAAATAATAASASDPTAASSNAPPGLLGVAEAEADGESENDAMSEGGVGRVDLRAWVDSTPLGQSSGKGGKAGGKKGGKSSKGGKGGKDGKGKQGVKTKTKAKTAQESSRRHSGGSGQDSTIADGVSVISGSVVTGAGTAMSRSPRGIPNSIERLKEQTVRYLGKVDLCGLVVGKQLGNEVNHATRIVNAWTSRSMACAEQVELKALLELAEVAKSLRIEAIGALPKSLREERLRKLVPHMPSIPPAWGISLCVLGLKDAALALEASDDAKIAEWVSAVQPLPVVPGVRVMSCLTSFSTESAKSCLASWSHVGLYEIVRVLVSRTQK